MTTLCHFRSNNRCKFKCSQNSNRWRILRNTGRKLRASSSIIITVTSTSLIQSTSAECLRPREELGRLRSHSTHSTNTSNRAVNQSCTPPASMAWDRLNPLCRLVSHKRLNFQASQVEEPMETLALSHYSETHLEVASSRQIRMVLRRIKHSQTHLPGLAVSQLRTSASS